MSKRCLCLLLSFSLLYFNLFAENLLRNPAMDRGSADGGYPADWVPQDGVECKLTAYEDGTHGLMASRADAHANVVQRDVPLEAGVEYRFMVKVRGEQGAQGCFYVERSEPNYWCALQDFTCNGAWQTLELAVTIPDEGSRPYAVLRAKQGHAVEFASPVLEVVPGRLQNGSFRNGGRFWTLENAVVEESGDAAHGKLARLDGTENTARIWQGGIQLQGGQLYKLEYDVKGGTDPRYLDIQKATWFRIAAYEGDNLLPGNEIWQDSFASWQHKSLTFAPDHDMEITIVGELKNNGTVYFDNIMLAPTTSPILPVELALDCPWSYHNAAVAGSSPRFSGALFLSVPATTVRLSFNGQSVTMPGAAEVPFDFALPAETGDYAIEAVALDAEGVAIATESLDFRVIPPARLAEGAHVVTFDAKRVMYVDGEPFFPIGSWNLFGKNNSLQGALQTMAGMGFNMVLCAPEHIDAVAEYGLLAMVQTPREATLERTPDEMAAWLAKPGRNFAKALSHPSTIAWFSTDEPAWGGRPVAPYERLYEAMGRLDPYRPVFLNEAPRGKVENLRPYANACDTYGVDIYPIPSPNSHSDLTDKTMTSVGKYTDICNDVVRGRKPLWMTLQGFAWGEWNRSTQSIYPSREETRFMIYEAISHGATGLLYWGTMSVPMDQPFVADLGANLLEVQALARYLVGDTIVGEVNTEQEAIRICQKRTAEGDDLWIVLNESPEPVTATLKGALPPRLRVVGEARVAAAPDGALTEEFGPYGLHIYRDAARPLAKPLKRPATTRLSEKVALPSTFEQAKWVWYPGQNQVDDSVAYLRQTFTVKDPEHLKSAFLSVVVDDYFKCSVNGREVMRQENWECAWTLDILPYLHEGENEVVVKGMDAAGAPCGAIFALTLSNGVTVLSGESTQASQDGEGNWVPAEVIGDYGCEPWGKSAFLLPYETPDCERDFEK